MRIVKGSTRLGAFLAWRRKQNRPPKRRLSIYSVFLTAVAVFQKPNAIPLCLSVDLLLNFLLSWLLVLLPSTFFLDVLFFLLSRGIHSIINFGILPSGILLAWPYRCYRLTLRVCSTYCFSMATMVTRTCFPVTFIRTLPVLLCGYLRLSSGTLFVWVVHICFNCVLTDWQSAVPRPVTAHVAPHSLFTPLTPLTGEPGLVPTLQ